MKRKLEQFLLAYAMVYHAEQFNQHFGTAAYSNNDVYRRFHVKMGDRRTADEFIGSMVAIRSEVYRHGSANEAKSPASKAAIAKVQGMVNSAPLQTTFDVLQEYFTPSPGALVRPAIVHRGEPLAPVEHAVATPEGVQLLFNVPADKVKAVQELMKILECTYAGQLLK